MPHLIIEYAQELADAGAVAMMLQAVHEAAVATKLFDPEHIRTRAVPVSFYRTGTQEGAFIHAQLRIHPGRDAGQKRMLSEAVLAAIRNLVWEKEFVLTVEVAEMDRDSYAKYPAD